METALLVWIAGMAVATGMCAVLRPAGTIAADIGQTLAVASWPIIVVAAVWRAVKENG